MAKCLNCGKELEQTGNRPKLYCSDKCKVAFHRGASIVTNETSPIVTGEYKTFDDLPEDIQDEINHLTTWCAAKGIEDDRNLRIKRALDYHNKFVPKRVKGVCYKCGEKLDNRLVCCGPCVWEERKAG